jgi:hypothetical protein
MEHHAGLSRAMPSPGDRALLFRVAATFISFPQIQRFGGSIVPMQAVAVRHQPHCLWSITGAIRAPIWPSQSASTDRSIGTPAAQAPRLPESLNATMKVGQVQRLVGRRGRSSIQ